MPLYSEDQLANLKEVSKSAGPDQQTVASTLVARILEQNDITYGVMGGDGPSFALFVLYHREFWCTFGQETPYESSLKYLQF